MTLSDLQRKDVVNMLDGKRLGRISDAEINENGNIIHFIVEPKHFFLFFRFKQEVTITFNQIKKIGEDVILVEFTNIDF